MGGLICLIGSVNPFLKSIAAPRLVVIDYIKPIIGK
jgi:hypothetical protein